MKAANNRVEVLVLSFNTKDYIDETLNSLMEQTVRPIITVIDDCSTDGSREYLEKKWSNRINVIFNEANIGVVGNINSWLAASTAEYLIVHGADDISPSTRIESDLNCFNRNPGAVAVLSFQNKLNDTRLKSYDYEERFCLQDLLDLTVKSNISYMIKNPEKSLILNEEMISEEPQLLYKLLDITKGYAVKREGTDGLLYRIRESGLTATRMSEMTEQHKDLLIIYYNKGYTIDDYLNYLHFIEIWISQKWFVVKAIEVLKNISFRVLAKHLKM